MQPSKADNGLIAVPAVGRLEVERADHRRLAVGRVAPVRPHRDRVFGREPAEVGSVDEELAGPVVARPRTRAVMTLSRLQNG